jgi:hypothetical protein
MSKHAFSMDALMLDIMAMNEANARAYRLAEVLPTVTPPEPVEGYEFADDEVCDTTLGGQAWPVRQEGEGS